MAEQGKQSFEELMGKLPSYGPLMDTPASYKLIAVHNGTYWSLAIKGDQPDQDLPYVTIELISDDGIKVLRAVRKVDYELLHLLKRKDVGTYGPNKKLRHLCKAADDTFHGIDKWHEFCPQLVNSLGYQVDFDKTTSTYYTIEVFEGSGYRMCYLGTANNGMLYGPTFPSGNLAGKQKNSSEEGFFLMREEGEGGGIIQYNMQWMATIHCSSHNLTVYWKKLDRDEEKSKVINFVTALSPDPTFMQLGPQISGNTYQVILRVGNACPCTFFGITHFTMCPVSNMAEWRSADLPSV